MVASLIEIFGSPTRVHQEFAEQFPDHNPPSCLTIYQIYAKFVSTGLVANNCRGNAGQPRKGRNDVNIPHVQ